MFIVVPYLTKEPAIYGIYTICISISIFLAYADLGFLGAGQKYAAECYARDEREEEVKIIGFTSLILLIFVLLCTSLFFFIGFNPQLLIKNLDTPDKVSIASKLLLILASFAPVTVLQRINQMIFGIRLDDYLFQRISSGANFIKILSVLYFFRDGKYLIVEYFLFCQLINTLASLTSLFIAKKRYHYNLILLIKSIRFNTLIYNKVYKLAFSSLFLTLMWILYYELDTIVIGKFLGAEKVAIYAIGLTMISFFRSILGILFSPIGARFNHFIGQGKLDGLKTFIMQVITLTSPVVVIPIIALTLVVKPFVLSWVGIAYSNSIGIASFLLLCNILAFISYPASMLLMAQEKVRQIYFVSSLIPIIYWGGVIFSYSVFGLESFAIFKFTAFLISAFCYLYYLLKFQKESLTGFLKKIIIPLLIPIAFLVCYALIFNRFLPTEKSKLNVLEVIGSTGLSIFIAFIIQYSISSEIKKTIGSLITNAFKTE